MVIASSISGLPIYAPSAAFAPTNSADVSAIASAYQVVSATATQLYAGTAYVTSVNDAPVSAARAGNAANASLATSAYYDGTGRLISALPDSAAVSAIASSYVESGVSSKQDTLSFAYNTADQISSINGSALGGMDEAAVSGIASAYAESAVSSVSGNYYTTANESGFLTAQVQASWSESASASPSYIVDKPDLVDIVAGPGIVVDNPDGNTLRVSMAADYEEALYTAATDAGTTLSVNGYITLSESLTHFEKVKIYFALQPSWGGKLSSEIYKVSGDQRIVLEQLWYREQSGYNNYWQTITFSKYDDANLKITLIDGSQRPLLNTAWGTTGLTLTIYKVVGINRISGGN